MLKIFDFCRDMDLLAIFVRLSAAVICGACVGIERELKRRPAGFRTHTLICLGAAITTLTSQYLYLVMHLYTDVARLGAQVIAGVGFIGAGTIIVTRHKKIKGLTTAAGLWTSAIIGLVCGAGFVECAIVSTFTILLVELFLSKIEYRIIKENKSVNLYIEYSNSMSIDSILHYVRDSKLNITDMEITRADGPDNSHYYCALITIQGSRKLITEDFIDGLRNISYVKIVDEL